MTKSRWILPRMANVSNESCREYQSTHFMSRKFFSKIVPFMRKSRELWRSQRGRRWQYGACALHSGSVRVFVRKHTQAPLHPHAWTHPRTRAHTQKYVILIAFPQQQWLRERVPIHCLYCSHISISSSWSHVLSSPLPRGSLYSPVSNCHRVSTLHLSSPRVLLCVPKMWAAESLLSSVPVHRSTRRHIP